MEENYTVADITEIGRTEETILGKTGSNLDENFNEIVGVDVD